MDVEKLLGYATKKKKILKLFMIFLHIHYIFFRKFVLPHFALS